MNDKFLSKLLSGRFMLTMIAGIVFTYVACTAQMPMDKVSEIILIVIYAYFTRNDRNKPQGGANVG